LTGPRTPRERALFLVFPQGWCPSSRREGEHPACSHSGDVDKAGLALLVRPCLSKPSLVLFLVGGTGRGRSSSAGRPGSCSRLPPRATSRDDVHADHLAPSGFRFPWSEPGSVSPGRPAVTPYSPSAPPSRSAWRCRGGRCSVDARVAPGRGVMRDPLRS
jgi:hypothetical protein